MNIAKGYSINEADGLTNLLMSTVGADTACDVITELRRGWEVEKTLAAINQQKIAQSVQHGMRTLDGLGQHTHSVDIRAYLYWHARTNGECWKDPKFWDEFGRDNPATRVPYASRGATIINNKTWKPKVRGRVITEGWDEPQPKRKEYHPTMAAPMVAQTPKRMLDQQSDN